MNAKQIIREKLGLSQRDLAQYLLIPSSQIAMYEAGKRDLPTASMLKLASISLFLEQNQSATEELKLLNQKQKAEALEQLTVQARELEYKQLKAQRALDTIEKKYHQNINLYYFAKFSNQNHSTQEEALLIEALNGIKKNSLEAQLKQKIKLQGILRQAEYVAALITNYEKNLNFS